MGNHRTAIFIFAVVLAVVIAVAFVTTLHGVDTTRLANNEPPPGVSGLSQPHAQLDVAPGRAVQK
jgi:hypothetical protein